MAVNFDAIGSTDPTQVALADPRLQNDPAIYSLLNQQSVGPNVPTQTQDLSRSNVNFNSLGLSGESYAPSTPISSGGTDPLADLSQQESGSSAPPGAPQTPSFFNTPEEAQAHYQSNVAPAQAQSQPQYFNTPEEAQAHHLQTQSQRGNVSSLAPGANAPKPQYGDDIAGRILGAEDQYLSPELRTGVHAFQENILPSGVGLGAGILASMGADALIGSLFGPVGTVTGAVIGLGAGLIAGFLAQGASQKVQGAIAGKFIPQQDLDIYEQERAKEAQDYPLEELGGQLASQLPMLRPSFTSLSLAARTAGKIVASRSFKNLEAGGGKALSNMAFGAGMQASMEGLSQIQQGSFNPLLLGAAAVGGSLFSEPTKLGKAMGLQSPQENDHLRAGQAVLQKHFLDGFEANMSPDPSGKLSDKLRELRTLSDTGGDEVLKKQLWLEIAQRDDELKHQAAQQTPQEATPGEPVVQPRSQDWQPSLTDNTARDGTGRTAQLTPQEQSLATEMQRMFDEGDEAGAEELRQQLNQSIEQGIQSGIPKDLQLQPQVMGALREAPASQPNDFLRLGLTPAEQDIIDEGGTYGDFQNYWYDNPNGKLVVQRENQGGLLQALVRDYNDLRQAIPSYQPNIQAASRQRLKDLQSLIAKVRTAEVSQPKEITPQSQLKFFKKAAKSMGEDVVKNSGEISYGFGFPDGTGIRVDPDHVKNVHERFYEDLADETGIDRYDRSSQETLFNGLIEIRQEAGFKGRLNLNAKGPKGLKTAEDYLLKRADNQPGAIYIGWKNAGGQYQDAQVSYTDFMENGFKLDNKLFRLSRLGGDRYGALAEPQEPLTPKDVQVNDRIESQSGTTGTIIEQAPRGAGRGNYGPSFYRVKWDHGPTTVTPIERFVRKLAPIANESELTNLVQQKGGFTYNTRTGQEPTKGWAVSPSKSTEQVTPSNAFDASTIKEYIDKNHEELAQPGNHLEAWTDDSGNTYLDVTKVTTDQVEALRLAGDHQQSIYNLETGETVDNPNYNGERYGVQQETADQGEGTSQVGIETQAKGSQQISDTSKVGTEADKASVQADVTNTTDAGAIKAPNAASDVTTPNDLAGSSTTTERSATTVGDTATTGTTGGRGTVNVRELLSPLKPEFKNEILAEAERQGLNIDNFNFASGDVPVLQHVVLTAEELGAKPGADNYLADQTTPVPSQPGEDYLAGVAQDLVKALQAKGENVSNVPSALNTDAQRILVALQGWDGKNFFENSSDFVDRLKWDNPDHAKLFKALLGIYGQGQPVYQNALDAVRAFSRIMSTVYGPDAIDHQPLMDLGILKKSLARVSTQNLKDVIQKQDVSATNVKIGPYLRAILDRASKEFPVDKWMKRLSSGKDGIPSQKGIAYETGRTKYVARMLGLDNPKNAQAAMWTGYKRMVGSFIRDLQVKAAKYPDLNSLANKLSRNLDDVENGDDFQTIFEKRLGMAPGDKLPAIPAHAIVNRYKAQLMDIAKSYTKLRYTSKGTSYVDVTKSGLNKVIQAPENANLVRELSSLYERDYINKDANEAGSLNTLRQDLGPVAEMLAARSYNFLHPSTGIEEAMNAVTGAEASAFALEKQVGEDSTWTPRPEDVIQDAYATVRGGIDPHGVMEMHYRNDPKASILNGGAEFSTMDAEKAWVTSDAKNLLSSIRGPYIKKVIRALQMLPRDEKNPMTASVKALLGDLELLTTNPHEFIRQKLIANWAHESIHGITMRFWGAVDANGQHANLRPVSLAKSLVHGENALPTAYWEMAAKRGLGDQVDAVLTHSTGMSLEQWVRLQRAELEAQQTSRPININFTPEELQGIQTRLAEAPTVDEMNRLIDANTAIMEDVTQVVANHMGIPMSKFSSIGATDEVLSRDFYEPKQRKDTETLIGKWYRDTLSKPQVADRLATEAEKRLQERGTTTSGNSFRNATLGRAAVVQSTGQVPGLATGTTGTELGAAARSANGEPIGSTPRTSDPTAADQTRLIANQSERYIGLQQIASNLQDRLDRGMSTDPGADKAQLEQMNGNLKDLQAYIDGVRSNTLGALAEEGQPKAVRKLPTVAKGTADAVNLPRREGEGDSAYVARVVKLAGIGSGQNWKNVDHVHQIISAALPGGIAKTEVRGGRVGTVIEDRWYPGSPQQIALSMDSKFKDLVNPVDGIANRAKQDDPLPQPLSPKLDLEQLHFSLTSEPRSTARTGAVRAVDKFGKPLPAPEISSDHFANTGQHIPSGESSPSTALNQIQGFNEKLDESIAVQNAMKHDIDPAKVSEKAQERLAKKQSDEKPTDESQAKLAIEPKDLSSIGMTAEQRQEAVERQEQGRTREILRSYGDAFLEARRIATETKSPNLEKLANTVNDLLALTLRGGDMRLWMSDPRTHAMDMMGEKEEMHARFEDLGKLVSSTIDDNEGVMNSIDVPNEEVRQQRLRGLSDQDRAIADILHHYWQMMGDVGTRSGVLRSFLEHYLPHIIDKETKEVTPKKLAQSFATKTPSAINRAVDEFGDHKFPTVNDLQAHLDDLETGSIVVRDVGKIFEVHGQAMSTALLMRRFIDRAQSDLEIDFPLPNGTRITAPPMVTRENLFNLPQSARDQYREIKIGPMRRVATHIKRSFDRNNTYSHSEPLYVWKPLAENMERLASMDEVTDPLGKAGGILKGVRGLNAIFKQYKFKSPMHALSMMSGMGTMTSKAGMFGLPPIFDRTIYKIMGRGKEIVNKDRDVYYRGIRAGLPARSDRTPENMGSVDKVLEKIPGIGAAFKWFDDMMWTQVGYHGTFGTWEHLANQMSTQEMGRIAKEEGVARPLTPEEQLAVDREAAYHAKNATGYLTNLDMSKNWDLLGNTALLANRWTTGQMRSLGTAFNIKGLKDLGGANPVEGANAEQTAYLQRQHIALAQKLVFGGTMRLLMTSLFASTALSAIFNNGVPSTPVQNFMKDPLHTWDIYTGRDPQTNRDRWIRLPFYYFQREMADYGLAAVKAYTEHQDQWSTVTAPFAAFSAKMNPITKLGLELSLNTEIGKWVYGYANNSIDDDKSITNIHQSLNNMGVPDAGGLENRIIYALHSLMPSPALAPAINLKAPTNDPKAVANALGIGLFAPTDVDSLKAIGLGVLGTREQQGTSYFAQPGGGEKPGYELAAASAQKKEIGDQILTIVKAMSTDPAVQKAQWQQIEELRQKAGLTAGQLSQVILYGVTHGGTTEKGILYPPTDPTQAQAPKPTKKIGNTILTPQENVAYEQVSSQRMELALAQLLNDPNFNTWDFDQRQKESNSITNFANKITDEQFALALGAKKGFQISNIEANSMLSSYGTLKRLAVTELQKTPGYAAASPTDQSTMSQDRMTVTQNAVWDRQVGSRPNGYVPAYKGFTDAQLLKAIDLMSGARDQVRLIVHQLPAFNGSDIAGQTNMMDKALTFADTLAQESIKGQIPRTFAAPLNQAQIYTAVRNGVVLQDEAVNSLYQTQAYTEADPQTKVTLENKYIALAHNIALADMKHGYDSTKGQGYQEAIRTQLAADDAYQQLVDTYGGTQAIAAFGKSLTDLKTTYKQEYNIPPSQLASVERYIDRWFYGQHPEYYSFLTQRSNWKKYDPLGQAYAASTSGDLGFESQSPVAQYAPPLQP